MIMRAFAALFHVNTRILFYGSRGGKAELNCAYLENYMSKKMLIDSTHSEETRVAVVDGGRLDDVKIEFSGYTMKWICKKSSHDRF